MSQLRNVSLHTYGKVGAAGGAGDAAAAAIEFEDTAAALEGQLPSITAAGVASPARPAAPTFLSEVARFESFCARYLARLYARHTPLHVSGYDSENFLRPRQS